MLKLYNTLTRKIEVIPKKDHLNLYTCGPTVYNYAHIGNLRSYIMADLLYRTLKYDGYNPVWVMNITDIDDKTIKGAKDEFGVKATKEDLKKFTDKYIEAFKNDLAEVNVLVNEINFYRVTDYIKDIQKFIVDLLNKGYAYKADDGSIYFSIEKYQNDPKLGDYGQLVGEKFLEGKKVGARVAVDEYEKENLSDFALWKAWDKSTDANIYWDHPTLGKGRPGWHIECSVINQIAFKGEPTDIHTGGVDLIFPHHTNEIAQSQALLGKGNFVHHWFHSEHLLVDGKKMAKRDGNVYLLSDLKQKGFSGQDFRYLMLSSNYRYQQNFTFESLTSAKRFRDGRMVGDFNENEISIIFKEEINNDLNFSQAIGNILARKENLLNYQGVTGSVASVYVAPERVQYLLNQRNKAKNENDFNKSDELRKQIEALGYEVMDTAEGQKIRKKINL